MPLRMAKSESVRQMFQSGRERTRAEVSELPIIGRSALFVRGGRCVRRCEFRARVSLSASWRAEPSEGYTNVQSSVRTNNRCKSGSQHELSEMAGDHLSRPY